MFLLGADPTRCCLPSFVDYKGFLLEHKTDPKIDRDAWPSFVKGLESISGDLDLAIINSYIPDLNSLLFISFIFASYFLSLDLEMKDSLGEFIVVLV